MAPGYLCGASGVRHRFLVSCRKGAWDSRFSQREPGDLHFELAQEWADRFGASIDDAEMREIRAEARAAETAFESDLATLDGAAERDLRTRADFDAFSIEVLDREYGVQQAGGEPDDALKADIALSERILALPSHERAYEMDLWLQALEGKGAHAAISRTCGCRISRRISTVSQRGLWPHPCL